MKLSSLSFHLSTFSSNAKTGPIAVSTSSRATCSPSCPFFQNGCYAESGPLLLHWRKVTEGLRGVTFSDFLSSLLSLESGRLFRHNQAGDLPHTTGRISRAFIRRIVASVQHLKAFTYTHHDIKLGENLQLLKYANRNGFTINLSTESESAADDAIAAGLPAVMVANSDETRTTWHTPAGNTVLVCPAQRSDTTTCADCKLCHHRGRRVVIAFLAHGTGKRKANAAIAPTTV
jgi:hypothetical protein